MYIFKKRNFTGKMDIEDIDFLSRSKISELRVMVNNFVIMDKAVSSSGRRLTPIEKAELLESLATMEFYEGNWHQSVQSFRPSLTEYEETHSRRNPEQLISSFILVIYLLMKRIIDFKVCDESMNYVFVVWNRSFPLRGVTKCTGRFGKGC